jgi:hypothetical protein
VTNGRNHGDLPSTFVLDYHGNNLGKGHTRIFSVGDLSITITNKSEATYSNIVWNSKTGIVSAKKDGDTEPKPIPFTGNSLGTIPVGQTLNITIK